MQSRYYSPKIGRFICTDNQLLVGDDLTGTNLFAYCGNNPANRTDQNGQAWYHWAIGAAIVAGAAIGLVAIAGGIAAAAVAVTSVAHGVAAATTAATIAAGAFIGASAAYGLSAATAAIQSRSARQFNSRGNWGTVANTVTGGVAGGVGAYATTNNRTRRQSSSVSIQNDIIDLPRIGSAVNKNDPYHAFPDIIDNYAGYATRCKINNGTLYQLEGSFNGVSGRFEWIVQDQMITHRMFVKGGSINGIAIMP